jgi:hypothetical protein
MALTQFEGPLVAGGRGPAVNNYQPSYNPDGGPSLGRQGWGRFDPRWQYQANYSTLAVIGWTGNNRIPTVDAAPATASTSIIAAAQAPSTSTGALALTTTSGTGVTVLSAATTVYPSGTLVPANAVAIDGAPALLSYGQSGKVQTFDPRTMLARAVVVTYAGNDAGVTTTITGYDVYGYLMHEQIAGASGTAVNGKKAFKFITGATVNGTATGSNISVGTLDIYGLPIRADSLGYFESFFNSVLGTSSGFTAAVTATATLTTGDVRGTYNPGTANGTKVLQMFITPNPVDLQASDITGMAGVTQF